MVLEKQQGALRYVSALLQAASNTYRQGIHQLLSEIRVNMQDLQPKSTGSANGVSLDPNHPNALPGPLR